MMRYLAVLLLLALPMTLSPGEDTVPQPRKLDVVECIGGPSPQAVGAFVHFEALPDGTFCAFTQYPEEVRFFNRDSSRPFRSFNATVSLPLVVAPDGKSYLCSIPAGEDGFFKIAAFSLEDGRQLAVSQGYSGELYQLLYSRKLKKVVFAPNSGIIRVLHADLKEEKVLTSADGVFSLTTDAEGERLVVFTPNRTATIYSISEGTELCSATGMSFQTVNLLGGSDIAVVNTFGSGVKLYDLASDKLLHEVPGDVRIKDVNLAANQKSLFISYTSGKLAEFAVSSEKIEFVREVDTEFRGGAFLLSNTSELAMWSAAFIELYALADLKRSYMVEEPKPFDLFALAPGATSFVAFHADRIYTYELVSNRIFPKSSSLLLNSPLIDLRALRYYGSDKVLMVGESSATWFNPNTHEHTKVYDFSKPILSPQPVFCCSGKYLVTMGKNSIVAVTEAETGAEVATFLPTTYLEEAVVSSDLRLIATRAVQAEVYDLATRDRLISVRRGLMDLSFSQDASMLYGYNSTGFVAVNVADGSLVRTIPANGTISRLITGRTRALAFTNKGISLLNIAEGKVEAVWEHEDFEVVGSHWQDGTCLFFDKDRKGFVIKVDLN